MKYVFKKGIRKDATKQMEDICRLFFRHILDHVDHKYIVSLSEIVRQEDLYTVYNYRGLSDEGREIIRRSLEDLQGREPLQSGLLYRLFPLLLLQAGRSGRYRGFYHYPAAGT